MPGLAREAALGRIRANIARRARARLLDCGYSRHAQAVECRGGTGLAMEGGTLDPSCAINIHSRD
jgi:hypothetical protein